MVELGLMKGYGFSKAQAIKFVYSYIRDQRSCQHLNRRS